MAVLLSFVLCAFLAVTRLIAADPDQLPLGTIATKFGEFDLIYEYAASHLFQFRPGDSDRVLMLFL